ncbi:MAG: hybrid sensor histidine kinase/response regulator [Salinivirgaceae bacterium]
MINKTPRILIVDDFVSNIQVMASMLKPHNYDIEFTTSGTEALEWVQQEEFDLILLDVMMPEMDGFEVCARLKKNNKTKDIPIIFVTAKTDEESIQRGFKAGAVDFLTKPYRESELVARVKNHITLELQRKELLVTNQAKDRLFSIIGHDLKNPMGNIYGFLKLLSEGYDSFSDEKKKQYIGFLLESSKQNLKLLEELLEWSRTQTNSKPFQPEQFDLAHLVDEVVISMQKIANKKSIRITKKINYYSTVYADSNMIKTVLRNLIGNAIKFTEPEGNVKISITKNDEDERVVVSIEDSGVGIPEKNIDKLFNIEHHISTNGTDDEKGTGLGLILCKEFINKHNEKIWVESEINKGSTFSFTLNEVNVNKE